MTEEKIILEAEPVYNQNQTQFSSEEPLFEKPPLEPLDPNAVQTKKPKPLFIFLGIFTVVLVGILIFAALNKPQSVVEEEPELTPTPKVTKERSPIEQKLEVAVEKLEKANPTTENFPFPPVNMELRIDEPER